ncbi:MAG: hypothetical protein ACYDCC_07375 [Actinomycetota bacterium]
MSLHRLLILGLVLALSLAACGGSKPSPKALATTSRSSVPTVLGNTKSGRAHVVFSGGYKAKLDLPIDNNRSQLHAPPGGFALFWASGRKTLLSLGGVTFSGTRKTSPALVVAFLWIKGADVVSKTSTKGECSITMRSVGTSISGSFACVKLTANGKTYSVNGTYSAAA